MLPIHPKIPTIHRSIRASRRLEKLAEHYADDPEVLAKIGEAKIRIDDEIFRMAKTAIAWKPLLQKWAPLAKKSLIAGGVGGAAAGVPLYFAGSRLMERGKQTAADVSADIRNKAIQTALGIGGVGLGVYGLGKLMGGTKTGADESERVAEALEKLATVGVVEDMLDALPNTLDEETQKLATEVRVLNRSYGIYLLDELYG